MQERESKLAKFSFPLLASNFASVFGDGVYRFGLNWFLVSSYGNAQVLGWLTGFICLMMCMSVRYWIALIASGYC